MASPSGSEDGEVEGSRGNWVASPSLTELDSNRRKGKLGFHFSPGLHGEVRMPGASLEEPLSFSSHGGTGIKS